MPITTLEEATSQKRLRVFALVAAVVATLQTLVAVTMMALRNDVLVYLHEGLGYLYVAAAVVTVFPAVVWGGSAASPVSSGTRAAWRPPASSSCCWACCSPPARVSRWGPSCTCTWRSAS